MNILVTGATGFIGSAFSRLALSRGHSIGGMMLPTEKIPAGLDANEKVTWFKGTLAEPPWQELAEFKPDACIHFAWIATPGIYLESPENENYFHWSREFVRRIREFGAQRIVAAGTCIEYRISNEKLSEDKTPIGPTTTYARWKDALRVALEEDARKNGFRFAWTRVFYPYGVGEHPARLCSSIIQKLGRGEKIELKTPNSTKDYIYIEDLAAAFLTVLETQFEGIINLGTGIGLTVKEIADSLGQMMHRPELIKEMDPPLVDPLGYVVADVSRLRSLGWKPEHDLRRGLDKLLANVGGGASLPASR
jgi:dTDP-6-deoxy-L-talose 4-dehydrogenase (NAD+)